MTEQDFCDIQKKLYEEFFKEHGYHPHLSIEVSRWYDPGVEYKVLDVILWDRTDGGGGLDEY